MNVADVTLRPGEIDLGTWTLFYLPPGGGKYNGKLRITNMRLLYDAKYDASLSGMVTEALFIKWGSEGYLEIEKKDIRGVEVQKKLFSKKCILTLSDGSVHTFDYGAMNIDKAAAAIQAR
ncbi:MAG TPA: hypothetical protein VGL53_32150 [Bryobacteraceae bacterium]|jgi:hypothetical protein